MSLINLQRRIAEVGRIRIGQQVETSRGRTRPEKLSTFRLTSADKLRIEQAAHLYGGQPEQWQAPAGQQWQVITAADALDVIVPPTDMAFSQHFELWAAGGCQRRCDGVTETISEGPCLCDPDNRECSIHTRLSVMLRDLPGLGVWRIDTSGYYAAVELDGAVQVIQMAAGRGQMLPARLRLEQRMVKRLVDGQSQTRRFAVPVLDVEVSPGQLVSGAAPTRQAVTEGPSAAFTPVPAELPETPTRSIAEQAAEVSGDEPRPQRSNAAQPLPQTGIAPRTAAEVAVDEPPPAQPQPRPVEDTPLPEPDDGITSAQQRKLGALMKEVDLTERDAALAYVARVVGREVGSRNDLSKAEASTLVDALEADKAALNHSAPAGGADQTPLPAGDQPR